MLRIILLMESESDWREVMSISPSSYSSIYFFKSSSFSDDGSRCRRRSAQLLQDMDMSLAANWLPSNMNSSTSLLASFCW